MKKFLTVLLALSVVFTYTVGSAFAALPTDSNAGNYKISEEKVEANIEKAYKDALEKIDADKKDALDAIFGDKTTMTVKIDTQGWIDITRSAVDAIYADAYKAAITAAEAKKSEIEGNVSDAIKAVKTAGGTYKGYFEIDNTPADDNAWQKAGYATYDAAWENVATYYSAVNYSTLFTVTDVTASGSESNAVARKVFAEVKEAALEAVTNIKLDNYSKEYNGEEKSPYDLAFADRAKAITEIGNIVISNTADWLTCSVGIGKINAIYTAPVNEGNPGGYLYVGGSDYTGLLNIPVLGDELTEAAKLDWAQNKVLTKVNGEIDAYVTAAKDALINATIAKEDADKIADLQEAVAEAEEVAAAAKEIVKYLVENCEGYTALVYDQSNKFNTTTTVVRGAWAFDKDTTKLKVITGGKNLALNGRDEKADPKTYDKATILQIVQDVADLKLEAEIYKAAETIDGSTAVEVDKALAKAIDATYRTGVKAPLDVVDVVKLLYNTQKALAGAGTVKVNNRTYDAVKAWDDNLVRDYDVKYYDAVRNVMAEAADKIWAATTVAEAEAAFLAGYEAYEAVPTKEDKTAVQATKEFRELKSYYATDIREYIGYKHDIVKTDDYSAAWDADGKGAFGDNLIATLDDAYSVDELKELYAAAKAEVDNLKTKKVLEEEKAAIQKRIDALPTTSTAADAEAVKALDADMTAHNDYCKMIGDNVNDIKLFTKLTNAKADVKAALIKDIKDQYDAIYKDGKVTTDEADAVAALTDAVDAYIAYYTYANIAPTDYDDILKEVSPNNTTTTFADKANAALTDALVTAFEVMVAKLPADGSDVAGIKAARDAYEALPLAARMSVYQGKAYDKLADLEKLLIKHVESLKITAGSTAKKGSITVKWSVKGVAAAADGFRVYKSTKKNSGYGTKAYYDTKSASKMSYKNTKGLKKGTRYYYKVRAYVVIDGKTYYSDYSNKAYRVAK